MIIHSKSNTLKDKGEANCSESDRRIFEKVSDKNDDISGSNRQNELRSFQNEDKCIRLRMVSARGLGKCFSRRTTGLKVGGHDALARELFARSTFSLLFRSRGSMGY